MFLRAVLASGALLAVLASCKAPDAGGLFQPYDLQDTPAAGAGGAGSGGTFSLPPLEPLRDAGSRPEGQGGSLGLSGVGGSGDVSGNSSDAGTTDAGDAAAGADAAGRCSDNLELCDGLDNDCDGGIDEGDACTSDCAGFALQGRGYMFCSAGVTRDVAADRCELEGLRLAWIETAQENALLVDRIEAADVPPADSEEILTFIGGSDALNEGSWIWRGTGIIPDGVQFWQGQAATNGGQAVAGAYFNWADTEPNDTDDDEDCAVLSVLGNNNRAPGDWDDRDCDDALPFVCEAP